MGMTPYITTRRARFMAICGPVNIPWGTQVEAEDGILLLGLRLLCATTSQNARDFFARNDDGNGLERGRLSAAIIARLSERGKEHQDRWNKVWADPLCQKYRNQDHVDHWLWNHEFFEAPLDDLRHIAEAVGADWGART